MKIFQDWLNANRGMATTLRKKLKPTCNATVVSKVKHGKTPMPMHWMPVVAKLSHGELSIEALVLARLQLTHN